MIETELPTDESTDDAPQRRWTQPVFIALAIVIAVTAIAFQFAPSGNITRFPIRRVVAPKPPPQAIAENCPQLNNPGGRLDWTPAADPGPVPTNGAVTIPSQRMSAPIVRAGIDSGGLMVVPSNAREVAWLDQGGVHGRTNNLVLAGHIRYSGVAGSFSRIQDLHPGQFVVVTFGDDHLVYRVLWNCAFPRNTKLVDHIMGYTNAPSVTLISCGGVFDTAARTHTERIVVRAELVRRA